MATNKKTNKKKATKSKKSAGRKAKPTKKRAKSVRTKSAKKTAAPRKAVARKKSAKGVGGTADVSKKVAQKKSRGRRALAFSGATRGSCTGAQSGDLQGLSRIESADSESVDELIEEGNAFEAGVVSGVEDSGERGFREVRTREVPEDDVPEEYLEKD